MRVGTAGLRAHHVTDRDVVNEPGRVGDPVAVLSEMVRPHALGPDRGPSVLDGQLENDAGFRAGLLARHGQSLAATR